GSAKEHHAIAHAREPESALHGVGIEAHAVVAHLYAEHAVAFDHLDLDVPGARVLDGVVERFLRDAVAGALDHRRNPRPLGLGGLFWRAPQHDLDAARFLQIVAVAAQSLHQAELVERSRAQRCRRAAHLVDGRIEQAGRGEDRIANAPGILAGDIAHG